MCTFTWRQRKKQSLFVFVSREQNVSKQSVSLDVREKKLKGLLMRAGQSREIPRQTTYIFLSVMSWSYRFVLTSSSPLMSCLKELKESESRCECECEDCLLRSVQYILSVNDETGDDLRIGDDIGRANVLTLQGTFTEKLALVLRSN